MLWRGGWLQKQIAICCSKGQLSRMTATGAVPTLYEYSELGDQVRSGLDVNDNGVLDLSGPDRVNESAAWYEQDASGNYWQCRASILYAGDNSATPTTNSVQKTRLTGYSVTSNLTSEIVALDILGNITTSRIFLDRAAKTVVQAVSYPDSTNATTQTTINGHLASSLSKTATRTDYTCDALGRQISALQAGGGRTVGSYTTYNALGQVASTLDTASNTTTFAYDTLGRRIAVTDALSNTTYTAYDLDGRVLATWGATYPVAYEYDDFGRMTAMYTLRDPSLVISNYSSFIAHASSLDRTSWLYEQATGLLTNKLYSDNKGPVYTYTVDGKLASRTWARGVVTQYGYDSLGQLTNISYSDNTPAVTFNYDRLGRQAVITDGTGMRAFTYNDAMQLAAETNAQGVLQYAFDNFGRPAGFDAGPDYSVRYTYDLVGRFGAVQSKVYGLESNVFSYSYLSDSDLVQGYTNETGFSFMRAYEPNRNLITGITNGFGGVAFHRFDYVNDAVGRRTQRADVDISTVISNLFAYNARSELEDAAMGTNSYSYRYDPIGNRRVATNNAEAWNYAANALNQYSQISNQTSQVAPTYDLDGNMTSYRNWTFVWDAENRLVLASNATTVVSNTYDYMSRRVSKTVSSPTSSFIPHTSSFSYQGWAMLEEATSSVTNRYVYGLDLSGSQQGAGTIGGILAGNFSGTAAYFAYDANGNVADLVGTNGTFLAQYQFDPYGNTISKTGALADVNPFRFSTKYLDAETGFYYYGYRFYMPESGRWVGRDPLGEELGNLNLYNFLEGDTVNSLDMVGLKKCGVSSFVVKWSVGVGHGYRHGTMFRLDVAITFRSDGDYDPRCCEYKQNAGDKVKVTRGGRVILDVNSSLQDDHYSRDDTPDPWSGNTDRCSSSFTTWDTPGLVANYLKEGDVINYSFTAEQIVYSPGGSFSGSTPPCNCEKNDSVAKKGPHTATVRGTFSRRLRYSGAPATL